ncbi:MinD-like ATPase involved in chromosome partitioning or flagellar assembly [Streptosporangium canum]|uniref:MinD-like ATPase involved in chromosome partitioning or flagellar assembly n=1 Tax=Streptosporangium canum TaxID=324952 RepID=A0A1I3RF24_9ACTN|nr:AAA family ATPase [Streptosporangium canum]SFJ45173.1 MinD-like ATPase involved in chromosome partitioning or flagellar assembly [Streptosporangium canum]
MARHDREESLEEQLAWLDAIKEQEEAPPVAVKSTAMDAVDDAAISPYPKDPWSSVPSEPDVASSPLFRTAVDSAYDPAGAPVTMTDPPDEEADAADWMEAGDTLRAFTLPSVTAPPSQDNDGFLAPLKPLPRQEQGEGGHTTGEFTGPEIRAPHAETESRQEPSRGLFEQPRRAEEPESFTFRTAEPAGPTLEPFKPPAPEPEGFAFGGAGSDRDGFTLPNAGAGRDAFAFGGADRDRFTLPDAGSDPDASGSGGAEQRDDRSGSGGAEQRDDRSGSGGADRDDSRSGGVEQHEDRPASGSEQGDSPSDAESYDDRSASAAVEQDRDRSAFKIDVEQERDWPAFKADVEQDRDWPAFKADVEQDRDRSAFKAEPFTGGDFLRPAPERSDPEAAEPFRVPESFGADRPNQATPPERAPGTFGSDSSGFSGFARDWDRPFGSDRDTPSPSARETAFAPEGETASTPGRDTPPVSGRGTAFTPDRDKPFGSDRDTPPASGRDTAFASERETPFTTDQDRPFASGRDTAFASEREVAFTPERDRPFGSDRDTPSASGRETAGPAREPYQARRRQSVPPPAFSAPSRQQVPGVPRPSADSLDPESLLRGRRNGPAGGWRKLIYKASAGLIKPGESPEVRRRRELVARARTPVATGHHRVAVLSLKGGVGKTTTTVGLGATLAQVRGDRVIAVDANPDRGTLSDKLELETSATVRDLLNERQQIKRYVDIRAFTSQAPSRLEILASDRDPSVSEAFSSSDYQSVAQVLENFYSICITDCGTGLLHSAMSGVLGLADQLVLVSSPSVDGARAASATLDWLEAHHYEELVRSATVVLCSVRPRSKSTVDLDRLEAHFAARCRAVIRIPYDPHLEEGAEIDLERLQATTRESYLRLAASVGDGFAATQL